MSARDRIQEEADRKRWLAGNTRNKAQELRLHLEADQLEFAIREMDKDG